MATVKRIEANGDNPIMDLNAIYGGADTIIPFEDASPAIMHVTLTGGDPNTWNAMETAGTTWDDLNSTTWDSLI